jgi:hypothetical protein
MMADKPFRSVRRENGLLVVERPANDSTKLGVDADLLASVKGDLLFTQKALPTSEGAYAPGDRAQIYSNPDNSGLPYVELELTSPLRTLKVGDRQTLEVVWELRRLEGGEQAAAQQQRTPAALAPLLKGI